MDQICLRCARYVAATQSAHHICTFSQANSIKCDRCRALRTACVAHADEKIPKDAHPAALELLQAQNDFVAGMASEDQVWNRATALIHGIERVRRAARSATGDASSPLRPAVPAVSAPAPAPAPVTRHQHRLRNQSQNQSQNQHQHPHQPNSASSTSLIIMATPANPANPATPATPAPGVRPPITCHVLDTMTGRPARDLAVKLFCCHLPSVVFDGTTNGDGRIAAWKHSDEGPEGAYVNQNGGVVETLKRIIEEKGQGEGEPGVARPLGSSLWKLQFDTGAHYGLANTFFPLVELTFLVKAGEHFHVPLLLGPYSFTTYRGS